MTQPEQTEKPDYRAWHIPLRRDQLTLRQAREDLAPVGAGQEEVPLMVQLVENPGYRIPGFELFHGEANCWTCHGSAEFTGPGLHVITENPPAGGLAAGIKVPGLRGIAQTGPYFHDGSAATLEYSRVIMDASAGSLSVSGQNATLTFEVELLGVVPNPAGAAPAP